MGTTSFDTLPADILRLIFVHSPASIKQCQKVSSRHVMNYTFPDELAVQICRSLRNLINTDHYLQYLAQLNACGYVEPFCPRTDLRYADKANILRKHNSGWANLTSVTPDYYELRGYSGAHFGTGIDAFVKGTFMWPRSNRNDKNAFDLVFTQLPSTNRGTEFKQWSAAFVYNEFGGFWIDPEQDLLVVAEDRMGTNTRPYNLHLRSMATNRPHPRAPTGQNVLRYIPPATSWVRDQRVWICGYLLAAIFNVDRNINIIIWNWTTGLQVSYLSIARNTIFDGDCFEFLSENLFIVCRLACAPDAYSSFPKKTLGWISVYQFNPQAAVSNGATHMASFALPANRDKLDCYSLTMHHTPITSSMIGQCSAAKIYDHILGDRLLRMDVSVPADNLDSTTAIGTLYVASSVLLGALPKDTRRNTQQSTFKLIPWSEWADHTAWVDHSKWHPFFDKPQSFGHRLVIQPLSGSNIVVLDFDQRRMTSHGTVAPTGAPSPASYREQPTRARVCVESILDKEETYTYVNKERGKQAASLQILFPEVNFLAWIDEEHLVFQREMATLVGRKTSLLVYTP
ncbi:hypothetical protein FRC12_002709 [Ceratobasidium sp. 428]|nr:hypothetical protein FRC12_002709 [Ceratobasidium sp. 428]